MLRLKVVQALHGDCLILEYGSQQDPKFILIDGGPSTVYADHLKAELAGVAERGGRINIAVLSHVDDDHVNGLLDLMHDLVDELRAGQPEMIKIDGLWHNSFSQTLGPVIQKGLTRSIGSSIFARGLTPSVEIEARSISQGDELAAYARGLKIPINVEFKDTLDRVVCVDNLDKPVQIDNLNVTVVGPSRKSLQALQKEWEDWLAKQKLAMAVPTGEAELEARALDRSVPNLSSIMLYIEAEGKKVLLTGDGRGDQLLEGMQQAGCLDADGTCHVDVFKLPHHGSARNVTLDLFEKITADTYVVCANGKYDNPDFQTLEWLVQAAAKQGRSFTLVATNPTPSTDELLHKFDPASFHYQLVFIEPGANSISLDLSEPPQPAVDFIEIKGIGPVYAERLRQAGIATLSQLLSLDSAQLANILLSGEKRAAKILLSAGQV